MSAGTIAGGGPLTVAAGAEILRRGGNAADAALAAAFAAFHVEPLLASAAGGGMMIAGDAERGFAVLDFVPPVPGLGLRERPRLDFEGVSVDFGETQQVFHVGRGSAAVPTGLLGLHEGHRRWGRLPLREVVAPAARYCREGIQADGFGARVIQMLAPIWRRSPAAAALFTVDGRLVRAGDRLRNPDFAETLERLAEEGPEPFRTGEIARRTVAAFGADRGGLLTMEDLERYRPVVRAPLRVPVGGAALLTPPPPSTGGTLIALALSLLARRGLKPSDFLTARHLDAIVAAQLLTLAARREALSAGGFSREAVEQLLSEPELAALMRRWEAVGPSGGGTRGGAGSTTHVSVLDARGGAAAITVSYGEGCGDLVPGTGMMMNNFLGEADINPHGFHAQPAGTPMTSMMAPTIVVRDGRPVLVLGSGGANRLRSAILQVAFNRLGLGQPLDAAVRAPRVHVEDDAFFAELPAGDPPMDFSEAARAHGARFPRCDIFRERSLFFGGVHAVARETDGRLVGTGDPRRGGATVSVEA